MQLRYVFAITSIIVLIAIGAGLYCKSSYQDFNEKENVLDDFAVALISDDLLELQLENMRKNLDSSEIILAIRCEDTFQYRYACVTQKVSVQNVFKGENIKEGDVFEIARAGTRLSMEEDTLYNGMPLINMGFVNEMIPGKTYLIFLDRKLNTYSEETIYIQSDKFILAPIFCYEDIPNIPQTSQDINSTYVSYKQVKDNEFFISSNEANEKIVLMKEQLLSKYRTVAKEGNKT